MIRKAFAIAVLSASLNLPAKADLIGVTLSGDLYAIDDTTGAETFLGSTGAVHNSLAWDPVSGRLYSQSNLGLMSIDPFTAQSNLIGGSSVNLAGLTFGPNGLLYGVRNAFFGEGSADILVTVDLLTGAQSTVGSIGGSFDSVQALAFLGNTLYGYDLRLTEGLFTIDPLTGLGTSLPGGNQIAQDIQGLTASITGNFLWGISRGANGALIQFDPVTGQQTALGVPQTLLDFRGLVDVGNLFASTPVNVPEPETLLLLLSGLIAFVGARRMKPG